MERCHTEVTDLSWFEKTVHHSALTFHEFRAIFQVLNQLCISIHLEADY